MNTGPPGGPPIDAIPLRRVPTDVLPLLSGALEVLQEQVRPVGVTLVVEGKHDAPPVRIDPEKVAWVVTTLVGNAARYVRRSSRRLPGGTIRVAIEVGERALVIVVEDDGPGIPPEKLERLFERGNGVRHGAGLGLLMVRDVIAAHGGEVEVESTCGALEGGTRVTLRIPRG